MRSLVHRHIKDAITKEWPQMAERGATLSVVPGPLAELQAMGRRLSVPTGCDEATEREHARDGSDDMRCLPSVLNA